MVAWCGNVGVASGDAVARLGVEREVLVERFRSLDERDELFVGFEL